MTEQRLSERLEAVEAQLASTLSLEVATIRATLVALDKKGELIENELVADWHELYAQYVEWGDE
jgi:hypothetical protein